MWELLPWLWLPQEWKQSLVTKLPDPSDTCGTSPEEPCRKRSPRIRRQRFVDRTLGLRTRTSTAEAYRRSGLLLGRSVYEGFCFLFILYHPFGLGLCLSFGFLTRVEPGAARNGVVCCNSIAGLHIYSLIDVC